MLKGWRTLIFNALVALVGVAMAFDWTSVFSSEMAGKIIAVIGFINLGLRYFTTTPVGVKPSNDTK